MKSLICTVAPTVSGAYKAKRKIGSLKQERGRIVGGISKIGKSL